MTARPYPETTPTAAASAAGASAGSTSIVILAVFVLLWSLVVLSGDMRVRFDELHPPPLSLDVALIPYYTARTVLRMFIAFAAALLFTFVYGYIAAKSVRARKVMLPLLDILQSVPVLGFLSITVDRLPRRSFPGACSASSAPASSPSSPAQAWNMTFGFYHSLITIPAELQEAASVYRMNRWQRFTKVELPSSAIGLMWNSMMSFGGGWFFVAQSEAISVLNKNIKLPGLGSYMAAAVEAGDTRAAVYAIVAMIVTIVVDRSALVAAAGGVGREVQAGADRKARTARRRGCWICCSARTCWPGFPITSVALSGASRSARPRSAADVTQSDLRTHAGTGETSAARRGYGWSRRSPSAGSPRRDRHRAGDQDRHDRCRRCCTSSGWACSRSCAWWP